MDVLDRVRGMFAYVSEDSDEAAAEARVIGMLKSYAMYSGDEFNVARELFPWSNAFVGCCDQKRFGVAVLVLLRLGIAPARLDVNQTNRDGLTPLMLAAFAGHVALVRALLELPPARLDVNAVHAVFGTALSAAALAEHHEVTRLILATTSHAAVQVCGGFKGFGHPLHAAARSGEADIVSALVRNTSCDVNATNPRGETALMVAAREGHVSVVHALLARMDIVVKKEDAAGNTAMHVATPLIQRILARYWTLNAI